MTSKLYTPSIKKPIFCGNRIVGCVNGDVFEKTISGSIHFLQTPPGIAFDISTLDDAERYKAVWVKVVDRETGDFYRAKLQLIRDKGVKLNRRFGDQLCLTFSYWSRNGKPPTAGVPINTPSQPSNGGGAPGQVAATPEANQLHLF